MSTEAGIQHDGDYDYMKDGPPAYLGRPRRRVSGSVMEQVYIERETKRTDDPCPDYRFGPFSTENDARTAIGAIATVVTQIATKSGWEIVKQREERTSVDTDF